MQDTPNALSQSTSPYLLQHAYNPVHWFPWDESSLEKARRENKLLIISIGYSACHWCHVMERESFEDEEIAAIMNRSFINIKVDREERPDIDQVYMDAVQLMTGRGGWPLNVIAMPDQRPIYGGTYFPKEQWRQVLLQLESLYKDDPTRCDMYASELATGMNKMQQRLLEPLTEQIPEADHKAMLDHWLKQCDIDEGGPSRVPKFPLPDSYRYLLSAGTTFANQDVLDHVHHTLRKLAFGGIYDHIGGGFARYSTDRIWKVPHFEKMLYDNAGLVALFSDAYRQKPDDLYREIVEDTFSFITKEMTSPGGGFYSALDADSEGVEGKYYCWSPDELKFLPEKDYDLAIDYWNINDRGYWEHGMHIPLRHDDDHAIADRHGLSLSELKQKVREIRARLADSRSRRIKPGTDDKILCSWNAMMISALVEAYCAFGKREYLEMAERNARFISLHFIQDHARLLHSAKEDENGVRVSIPGFLEDYAFCIEAFISLFSVSGDENWLSLAVRLTETAMREFSDVGSGLFWFTSDRSASLVMRKFETGDNVIPSSNSVMAHNLLRLSRLAGNSGWLDRSSKMVQRMKNEWSDSTPWYSRWARVALEIERGTELAVCGPDSEGMLRELVKAYLPFTVFASTSVHSEVELLKNRFDPTENRIFVCSGHECKLPVNAVSDALKLIAGNPI